MMPFWKPVTVLLAVRHKVARHAFIANPAAFLSTILLAGIVTLAALYQGIGSGSVAHVSAPDAEVALRGLWLQMQLLWLLALLIPGGLTLLGPIPPPMVRRPLAITPIQSLLAELLACLLDMPLLPSLALIFSLALALASSGQGAQAIMAVIVFLFLALQTGVFARLLTHTGTLLGRKLRRWAEIPLLTALVLVGLCAGMPPALASLTSAPSHSAPLLTRIQPVRPALSVATLLPSALAAHAVIATGRADYPGMAEAMGGMLAWLGVTSWGTLAAFRSASTFPALGERRSHVKPMARASALHGATRAGPLSQIRALLITEARLLFRSPQNYLPLRKPAALLLLSVFAFLSPDMSRVDPVYNLKEFLGVGALIYSALWQIQLLCNRFGNESETALLLFSFSIPRTRLLLGKNLALFVMLWALDSAEVSGLSMVAEATHLIPLFMLWVPIVLLTFTALGNLVSVIQPFAIAPKQKQAGVEPPDALATLYIVVGCVTALLLAPVPALLSHGALGGIGVVLYLSALYGGSLMVSSRLLARDEHRILARLEGKA